MEIGWGRNQGSLVQVIKIGLAILGPQQLVVISNTHKENYFTITRGQEEVSLVQVIKRGLVILGPQQLVVISNTHKENYFTIKRK